MAERQEKRQRKVLSDEELGRILALMKGADSVELKATVPTVDQRSAVDALGLDAIEAQIRQVFFFDTPDLALDAAGLVVRARRVQGGSGDSVVKLRPVEPTELPKRIRQSEAFTVEVDAMPGGFVCSGSMKGVVDAADVRDAVRGGRPVRKLFSKQQRAFYDEHAPDVLGLDDLTILGPIFVLKLTAEMWLFPDNSRILELSTKCPPSEAFEVAAETRAFLGAKGIDLDAEQQTKTRTALELFAAAP